MKSQWKGVFEIFHRYWTNYGGWKSFFFSPYTFVALFVSLIGIQYALTTKEWLQNSISTCSSLLGFSFAAYAILLAFGNEGFLALMSRNRSSSPTTIFSRVNASFVHFIITQIISLLLSNVCQSLLASAWDERMLLSLLKPIGLEKAENAIAIVSATGLWIVYFSYIYAILMALAATMAVFRLSGLYGKYLEKTH